MIECLLVLLVAPRNSCRGSMLLFVLALLRSKRPRQTQNRYTMLCNAVVSACVDDGFTFTGPYARPCTLQRR